MLILEFTLPELYFDCGGRGHDDNDNGWQLMLIQKTHLSRRLRVSKWKNVDHLVENGKETKREEERKRPIEKP